MFTCSGVIAITRMIIAWGSESVGRSPDREPRQGIGRCPYIFRSDCTGANTEMNLPFAPLVMTLVHPVILACFAVVPTWESHNYCWWYSYSDPKTFGLVAGAFAHVHYNEQGCGLVNLEYDTGREATERRTMAVRVGLVRSEVGIYLHRTPSEFST